MIYKSYSRAKAPLVFLSVFISIISAYTISIPSALAAPAEIFSTPLFNDPNLVSYWQMEGDANDSKGVNNGVDSDVTYDATNGIFGKYAYFNATPSSHILAGGTGI